MILPAIHQLAIDHASLQRTLERLEQSNGELRDGDASATGRISTAVEDLLGRAWHIHDPFEEQLLDCLEERDPDSREAIARQRQRRQHLGAAGDILLEALEQIDDSPLSGQAVALEVQAFTAAWRDHLAAEEAELFPRLNRVLTPADSLVLTTRHLWHAADGNAREETTGDPLPGEAQAVREPARTSTTTGHRAQGPDSAMG